MTDSKRKFSTDQPENQIFKALIIFKTEHKLCMVLQKKKKKKKKALELKEMIKAYNHVYSFGSRSEN
jgi:hypothetical protein